MAKSNLTEEEKIEKRLKKLSITYDLYKDTIGLTGDIVEDIHIIVKKGMECQKEINECREKIKNDYEEVKKITPIRIGTYNQFVSVACRKLDGTLKQSQIDRFEKTFEENLYTANITNSFIDSYLAGKELEIVDDKDTTFKSFERKVSPEFEKILTRSAETSNYMYNTLKKRYKIFEDLAEYITKGTLRWKDYKSIVDFEFYQNGGYSNPATPGKLWSIFNKFNESYRNMDKYKFEQNNKLAKEFGLNITLENPTPTHHDWMDYENASKEFLEE